jgi:hypothetical protein
MSLPITRRSKWHDKQFVWLVSTDKHTVGYISTIHGNVVIESWSDLERDEFWSKITFVHDGYLHTYESRDALTKNQLARRAKRLVQQAIEREQEA